MEIISNVLLQWEFPGMMLVPFLYIILLIVLVYLLIRFLVAGRQFFDVMTAYFQQRIEHEGRELDD